MLRCQGRHVGRKRVERLMRDAGLQGAFLRKKWRIPLPRSTRRRRGRRIWSTGSSPLRRRTGTSMSRTDEGPKPSPYRSPQTRSRMAPAPIQASGRPEPRTAPSARISQGLRRTR